MHIAVWIEILGQFRAVTAFDVQLLMSATELYEVRYIMTTEYERTTYDLLMAGF